MFLDKVDSSGLLFMIRSYAATPKNVEVSDILKR
jgi:hypothetical protein